MFRSALTKTSKAVTPRASGITLQPALSRTYHEKVISHYENPRNVRRNVNILAPVYLIT